MKILARAWNRTQNLLYPSLEGYPPANGSTKCIAAVKLFNCINVMGQNH